jgi:hypothetical protein
MRGRSACTQVYNMNGRSRTGFIHCHVSYIKDEVEVEIRHRRTVFFIHQNIITVIIIIMVEIIVKSCGAQSSRRTTEHWVR